MKKSVFAGFSICQLLLSFGIFAQNKNPDAHDHGGRDLGHFKTETPKHDFDVIVGRPTANEATISIMTNINCELDLNYGLNAQKLDKTIALHLEAQTPFHCQISGLKPNAKYFYQLVLKSSGNKIISDKFSFRTAKTSVQNFTFDVQADSHLDENTGTEMYLQTLKNMTSDTADFLVDLGDTWMTDKFKQDYKLARSQYIAQRYYFGSACHSMSLFLTLGNHDGESGQFLKRADTTNMSVWSTQMRKFYYPNPQPNDFYSGNSTKESPGGLPQNYFAWEWSNALFVVLDPFRFTENNKNPWQRTLGKTQYDWLAQTLKNSKAKFKFVFIHNLVGGADLKGRARGGVEASKFYEWGGLDTNGTDNFASQRPNWSKPIHQLLVDAKVSMVFHGHDHFFAKQERDGVIYQLVPQPGALKYGNTNSAPEYGYLSGKIMNGPGYVRVYVGNEKATVDFVQTSLEGSRKNKEILHSYEIK